MRKQEEQQFGKLVDSLIYSIDLELPKELKFSLYSNRSDQHLLKISPQSIQKDSRIFVFVRGTQDLHKIIDASSKLGIRVFTQSHEIKSLFSRFDNKNRFIIFANSLDDICEIIPTLIKYPYIIYLREPSAEMERDGAYIHQHIYFTKDEDYKKLIEHGDKLLHALQYVNLKIEISKHRNGKLQYVAHPLASYNYEAMQILTLTLSQFQQLENKNPDEMAKIKYDIPYIPEQPIYIPILVKAHNKGKLAKIHIRQQKSEHSIDILHSDESNLFVNKFYQQLELLQLVKDKIFRESEMYFSLNPEEEFYSITSFTFNEKQQLIEQIKGEECYLNKSIQQLQTKYTSQIMSMNCKDYFYIKYKD
ncbi:hypothetical protein pb186bvf_008823 [Paramecium bursaria]